MSGARVTLMVTCVVVAALGGWFAVAKWDQANKTATLASALGAVAAVGVAVWTALRSPSGRPTGRIRVARTGKATATGSGSTAVSGLRGKTGETDQVDVLGTGNARADGGGNAVSGAQLD